MSKANISVPDSTLSATDCRGLADVLASVGDKWTILEVGALSKGALCHIKETIARNRIVASGAAAPLHYDPKAHDS